MNDKRNISYDRCRNCSNPVTLGLHDQLWRHVLKDGTYPIQCPNSIAVAEPARKEDSEQRQANS